MDASKLIRRFVEKTNCRDAQARLDMERKMEQYLRFMTTNRIKLSMEEREVKLDLLYLQKEKRRYIKMGSVLPEWYVRQQDKLENDAKTVNEQLTARKKQQKRERIQQIKERAEQFRERMLRVNAAVNPEVYETDLSNWMARPAETSVNKHKNRSNTAGANGTGRKEKIKVQFTTDVVDQVCQVESLSPSSQLGKDEEDVESHRIADIARYKQILDQTKADTLSPKHGMEKHNNEAFDPKFLAQERKRRDEIRKTIYNQKLEIDNNEKAKKVNTPEWLLIKQQEHEIASAVVVADEIKKMEEEKQTTYHFDSAKVREQKTQEVTLAMLQKYLKVLAIAEEQIREQKGTEYVDLGTTYMIKDDNRARHVVEDLKENMEAGKPRDRTMSAMNLLNCGYLRLTSQNIRHLEQLALDEHEDPLFHSHLTDDEIMELYNAYKTARELRHKDQEQAQPHSNAQNKNPKESQARLSPFVQQAGHAEDNLQQNRASLIEKNNPTPRLSIVNEKRAYTSDGMQLHPDGTVKKPDFVIDPPKQHRRMSLEEKRKSIRQVAEETYENLTEAKNAFKGGMHGEKRLSLQNTPRMSTLMKIGGVNVN